MEPVPAEGGGVVCAVERGFLGCAEGLQTAQDPALALGIPLKMSQALVLGGGLLLYVACGGFPCSLTLSVAV